MTNPASPPPSSSDPEQDFMNAVTKQFPEAITGSSGAPEMTTELNEALDAFEVAAIRAHNGSSPRERRDAARSHILSLFKRRETQTRVVVIGQPSSPESVSVSEPETEALTRDEAAVILEASEYRTLALDKMPQWYSATSKLRRIAGGPDASR